MFIGFLSDESRKTSCGSLTKLSTFIFHSQFALGKWSYTENILHNLEQIRVVKRTLINHKSCINNLQPKYPQRSSDSTIGLDYFSKISKRFQRCRHCWCQRSDVDGGRFYFSTITVSGCLKKKYKINSKTIYYEHLLFIIPPSNLLFALFYHQYFFITDDLVGYLMFRSLEISDFIQPFHRVFYDIRLKCSNLASKYQNR